LDYFGDIVAGSMKTGPRNNKTNLGVDVRDVKSDETDEVVCFFLAEIQFSRIP
jgi:hypothetical protein